MKRSNGIIVDAQAKKDLLIKFREELNLRSDQAIAIGDGANDIDMLKEAGVGIAYHAKPIVVSTSHHMKSCGLSGVLNLFDQD